MATMPGVTEAPTSIATGGITIPEAIGSITEGINTTIGAFLGMFLIPVKIFQLAFVWVVPIVGTIDSILAPFAEFGGV